MNSNNLKIEITIVQEAVCEKTAVQLSNAGFPKPDLAIGQVWYMQGKEIKVHSIDQFERFVTNFDGIQDFKTAIFAPNEDDIMKEMPGWELVQISEGWKFFLPSEPDKTYIHYKCFEACAAAWLSMNKTKELF